MKSNPKLFHIIAAGYTFCLLLLFASCSGSYVSYEERHRLADKLVNKALQSHKNAAAVDYLEKAVRLDSVHINAHLELARLYVLSGSDWKAESVLARGIQNGIRNSLVKYRLGELQSRLNKFNESVSTLETILPGDSLYLPAVLILASIYVEFENYAQSRLLADTLLSNIEWKNKPAVRALQNKLSGIAGNASFVRQDMVELSGEPRITRYQFARLFDHYFPELSADIKNIAFEDVPASDKKFTVCARTVHRGFLEILPDQKFYPGYIVRKRNLVFYLYNWMKKNNYEFSPVTGTVKTWIDCPSSDLQYNMMVSSLGLGIIISESDSVLGADNSVSGAEATRAFEKVHLLLSNQTTKNTKNP